MVNNNNLIIPKGNIAEIAKVTEVRYLDENYQPQSYEEFMKTYEPSEKVEITTETEYRDRLLHGPQYGPGNEMSQEGKQSAKFAGRKIIGEVGGGILGPAAITAGGALKNFSIIPIFANIMMEQATNPEAKDNPEILLKKFKEISSNDKDEILKWMNDLGDDLIESGLGSIAGEFFSGLSDELISRGSSELGEKIKEGWEGCENSEEVRGKFEDFSHFFNHMLHTKQGKDYDPECEVCKA